MSLRMPSRSTLRRKRRIAFSNGSLSRTLLVSTDPPWVKKLLKEKHYLFSVLRHLMQIRDGKIIFSDICDFLELAPSSKSVIG